MGLTGVLKKPGVSISQLCQTLLPHLSLSVPGSSSPSSDLLPHHPSGPCSNTPASNRSPRWPLPYLSPQPCVTLSNPSISLFTHLCSLLDSHGHDPLTLVPTVPQALAFPARWALPPHSLPGPGVHLWSCFLMAILIRSPDTKLVPAEAPSSPLLLSALSPNALQCSLACLFCWAPRL